MLLSDKKKSCFPCQERGAESALRGDHSAAIRAWDSALALSPDNAAVLHELKAQVYLERDRAWDAVQSASKAASLAPSWPEGHVTLGRSQLNLGEVMSHVCTKRVTEQTLCACVLVSEDFVWMSELAPHSAADADSVSVLLHELISLLPPQPELALTSMERALALSPGHAEAAAELAELRVLVLRRRAVGMPGGRRMQVSEAGMSQDSS